MAPPKTKIPIPIKIKMSLSEQENNDPKINLMISICFLFKQCTGQEIHWHSEKKNTTFNSYENPTGLIIKTNALQD